MCVCITSLSLPCCNAMSSYYYFSIFFSDDYQSSQNLQLQILYEVSVLVSIIAPKTNNFLENLILASNIADIQKHFFADIQKHVGCFEIFLQFNIIIFKIENKFKTNTIRLLDHFNMEQYIPYSLICDLFSRNLETYLHMLDV